MNVINTSMDINELAEHVYNDYKINPKDLVLIQNEDLKNYFEMLLMLFLEGLNRFCRYSLNENNKYDLTLLKENDIIKINSYMKKLNVKLNFNIVENTNTDYIPYDKININNNTNLSDLYYLFYVSSTIYVVNFSHIFI